MIDYARIKALEQENVKSNVKAKTISVSPLYLSLTILLAFLIYVLAYQNMSIAKTKHSINMKRVVLNNLILKQQSLIKSQSKALNLHNILVKTTFLDSPDRFKIEH